MDIFRCECGSQYQPLNKSQHLAGKKHQAWEGRKNLIATIHEATGVPSTWINSRLKKGYAPNQDWRKLYENFSNKQATEYFSGDETEAFAEALDDFREGGE